MAKIKTTYYCQNCGAQSPKWIGKCPACQEWNTYVEEVIAKEEPGVGDQWKGGGQEKTKNRPKLLSEIEFSEQQRVDSHDNEFNRVLGGGIVPGSLVLIGGEPGIGKSTLLLQIAVSLAGQKVLYVSGEESENQIKMRAERLSKTLNNCLIYSETSLNTIFKYVGSNPTDVLIIDSIQTMHTDLIESSPGSVSQIRECASQLMKFAKETGTPVFIIGHITKDGSLAGPKVLEHMVDTVLQFEGDRHLSYRILRTTKNRFGSTSELGIYEMSAGGLREVTNPSEILITQKEEGLSGITIGATLEGNRPLLIEIQSLVSPATYGNPQRSTTGFDLKRLNMLLAVLEKRCGIRLSAQDVFLNIAGGLKIEDPAIDLAICMALFSSFEEVVIEANKCFAAEVGLGGEIRAVNRIENRISEAEKLGFEEIFISRYNMKGIEKDQFNIKIIPVGKLSEVFQELFG
ncbi:MAG: DNA repair protein RadA [Cyclobacteriaceae bacterium]